MINCAFRFFYGTQVSCLYDDRFYQVHPLRLAALAVFMATYNASYMDSETDSCQNCPVYSGHEMRIAHCDLCQCIELLGNGKSIEPNLAGHPNSDKELIMW